MPCKQLSASVHSGYARMRRAMVFGSHHSPHPCTTAVEQGTEPTTRLPSPTAAHFWCCPLLLLQGTGGAAAPGPWARPSAFRVNHLFSCPVAFTHPASGSEASQGIKACVNMVRCGYRVFECLSSCCHGTIRQQQGEQGSCARQASNPLV